MSGAESSGVLQEVLRQCGGASELGSEWTQEQWCEAFSFLFLGHQSRDRRHAVLEHQDDMMWFVAAPSALSPGTSPVTLRRNTEAQLPDELRPGGSAFASVDWRHTLCLNLVVQAKYMLTVARCSQEALAAVAQEHASSNPHWHQPHRPHPAHAVVTQRRVYASPMAADVNLEGTKSGRPPRPCYPDVSFAVDNFEDAFEDAVLAQPGDCYCVMLHVHASHNSSDAGGGASGVNSSAGHTAAATASTPAQQPSERRYTLFSAYVTREQVADYLADKGARAPGPSLLHRLLGAPRRGAVAAASQRERLVMRGPGGIGRAEAAASALPAGAAAAAAAAAAAEGAQAALQLSLMWMSLPAHALAQAVLRFACS